MHPMDCQSIVAHDVPASQIFGCQDHGCPFLVRSPLVCVSSSTAVPIERSFETGCHVIAGHQPVGEIDLSAETLMFRRVEEQLATTLPVPGHCHPVQHNQCSLITGGRVSFLSGLQIVPDRSFAVGGCVMTGQCG